jgi:hypothetical protein
MGFRQIANKDITSVTRIYFLVKYKIKKPHSKNLLFCLPAIACGELREVALGRRIT